MALPDRPTAAPGIRFDLSAGGLAIDGVPLVEPILPALTARFGEPRTIAPETPDTAAGQPAPKTRMIWDDAGLVVFAEPDGRASALEVYLADDPEGMAKLQYDPALRRPAHPLPGEFTVNGERPVDALPVRELDKGAAVCALQSGGWKAAFAVRTAIYAQWRALSHQERFERGERGDYAPELRAAAEPFSAVFLTPPAPASEAAPGDGRWSHRRGRQRVLKLPRLPFRYAIIDELMYQQEALTPRFDLREFAVSLGAGAFDPDDAHDAPIPQVRDWFRDLPIPAELGERVETLVLDGGNEIYQQLAPGWDGEDGQFDIARLSAAELKQFPNLTLVEDLGGFLSPAAERALRARGIEVA